MIQVLVGGGVSCQTVVSYVTHYLPRNTLSPSYHTRDNLVLVHKIREFAWFAWVGWPALRASFFLPAERELSVYYYRRARGVRTYIVAVNNKQRVVLVVRGSKIRCLTHLTHRPDSGRLCCRSRCSLWKPYLREGNPWVTIIMYVPSAVRHDDSAHFFSN